MATSAVLEDAITCCICFNVYRDPHALFCLHTLCKPCIDQLEVNGKVKCPQCMETTDMANIRKDFRTQTLIDDHKNKQVKADGATESCSQCGMCNTQDKGVVTHCKECDHYMCAGCDDIHKGMKVCQGHNVKPVKDIIQIAQSKLEGFVNQWEKETREITEKTDKIECCIKGVQNQQDIQIEKVNKHFDDLISDLQKKRAGLIKEVRERNGIAVKGLKKNKQGYEEISAEIKTKTQMLREIINKKDITTMSDMGDDMDISLKEQIKDVKQRISSFNIEDLSPVEVIVDKDMCMKPGIQLRSRADKPGLKSDAAHVKPETLQLSTQRTAESCLNSEAVGASFVSTADFTKLRNNKYQLSKRKTLESDVLRICMINNNIWCAAYREGIQIYNENLELVREIKKDEYTFVTGIAEWGGDVIVSCSDGNGLHQIKQSGEYVQEIHTGDFTDVFSIGESIYAIQSNTKMIHIFIHAANKWHAIEHISVQNGGDFHDKLYASKTNIFVSLNSEHCIQRYNLQGGLMQTFGTLGTHKAGKLKYPMICGVDKHSNVLVADKDNNQLQVFYSSKAIWHQMNPYIINLPWPGDSQRPVDAIVGADGQTIWVATYRFTSPARLLKFTKV